MNVALYIRVSTEEQARRGLSLPEQRNNLQDYAATRGMHVVGEYIDAGISARKRYRKRPALLRLLDDCSKGMIDLILFTKLDRWFRNVHDYYEAQDMLDRYHVAWQATQEDYETKTASGRLKVNIMLSVAQDEADRTSERIKFVNDGKRARGEATNGRAPIGLMVRDRRYVPTENGQEMVQDMFSYFIKSRSVLALRRYMRDTWGVDRSYTKFRNYLQNRLYIGEVYGIANACPALVSQQDFDLANEIIASRSQRNSAADRIYLFSGILHCKECGKTMQSETITKEPYTYTYYRCRTHMLDGNECPHLHRIREDALEEYLLSEIHPLALRAAAALRHQPQKKPAISADKVREKMQRLKTLYVSGLIELDEYRSDYEKLKAQLDQTKPAIATIDPEKLKVSLAEYPHLTREAKKTFWTRTVKRIDADDSGAFFIELV